MRLWTVNSKERPSVVAAALNSLLVCLLIVAVFWVSLLAIQIRLDFSFIIDYRKRLIDGFALTLGLGIGGFLISFFIGLISALGQNSRILFFKYLSNFYVTVIRGTPLIAQIYLFFYILGTAWGIENRFLAGILILSVFEGAYISEILRGSVLSLDKEQLEAGKAVGFTRGQTIRFVILPQLVARTLPALTGQFASIIKDSSLLSMISVIEITQTIREITAQNFRLFEGYLFLGFLYLCITLPISFVSKRSERKFYYEN